MSDQVGPGRRAGRYRLAERVDGQASAPRSMSADVRLAEFIRGSRRIRNQEFGGDLFSDPAWDILLELFISAEKGAPVSATSLCLDANIPQTTLLRWIRTLSERGLIERNADADDARRVFVSLTEEGRDRMRAFFRDSLATLPPETLP